MATLSAIVPASNAPPTLSRAVAAIARSASAPEELIVVDGPPGLSAVEARNAGAWRAHGDILVFVDADVEVHPDAFARLRVMFESDPGLTAVFGSYDDEPACPRTVSAFRNLLHHHVHQSAAGPALTFWAGLGAVRREAFFGVGGFDARRFSHPSVEDIELGARLVAAGARIRLEPGVRGKHLKAWTLRSMLWTDFARRGMPWVGLQLREGRSSTALNCGWRHRLSAGVCLSGLVGVIRGRPEVAASSVLALATLNRSFYALLARRNGRRQAAVGVGLHALHHLCAVAAVPAGVAVHGHERARSLRGPARAAGMAAQLPPAPACLVAGPTLGEGEATAGAPPTSVVAA